MNTSKLLVIIGYVWPEPNSSAAGSRMLELIELFRTHQWRIIFASSAALSEHRFDLTTIGIEEKIIALNDSSFDEWIISVNPQAVLFDRFFSEEQFGWRVEKHCPQALRLLDTEDLHSLRLARQTLFTDEQRKFATEKEWQSLAPLQTSSDELFKAMAQDENTLREIAAIFRCDLSLMISTWEMDLLKNYFSVPPSILCYSPFLNTALCSHRLPTFSERQHFICIGNFRHQPNWDSVLYMKHAIWPLIRQALPHAELHIYGAYPPPKATQLHQPKEKFFIKGWASDAQTVMQSARVCLAPLRFGAGLKGKLMDAMRNGTPSVTTSIGAEAMCGNLPWAGSVENSAEEFAKAAIALYEDEIRWQTAQQNGFAILQNFFGHEDFADKLMDRIDQLVRNLQDERSNNFIGKMLRHHTLKSTQYMSQWIEAKNKLPPL